jgi:UDP-glucose 4-epimerase
MKILVTGGAGFIASHLVDALIKQGHKIVVVDNLSTGKKENVNKKAKFYRLDITSPRVKLVFQKERPQVVFHLAAQIDVRKSVVDPVGDANINIGGSLNILENCKNYRVKKVIFASTGGAIYGEAPRRFIPTKEDYLPQPLSPYGIGKLTVEYYLEYYYEVFGLRYVALRFSNVYGPRQNSRGEAGVVAIFIGQLLAGKTPTLYGQGQLTRDYIYVDDITRAALLAMRQKTIGSFNIATSKETNVNQIFSLILKTLKTKIKVEAKCQKPKLAPARPGEQKRSCLSWDLARRELGWAPKVKIEEGIKKTVGWFLK